MSPRRALKQVIPRLTINLGRNPHEFNNSTGDDAKRIASSVIRLLRDAEIPIRDIVGCTSVPVLRRKEAPMTFVDVKVEFYNQYDQSDKKEIFWVVLRIRTYDMYVVGYKPKGRDIFWEFRDDDDEPGQLIPNSEDIGFNGSYSGSSSLGEYATGWKEVSDLDDTKKGSKVKVPHRELMRLNLKNTADCVEDLCYCDPKIERPQVSRAVVHLVYIVSEMPRFTRILAQVDEQWYSKKCEALTRELVYLTNDWSKISKELQKEEFTRAKELGIALRMTGWKSPEELQGQQ